MHLEAPVGNGRAQLFFQLRAAFDARLQRHRERLHAIAPQHLGLMHRRIRAPQQFGRGAAVLREHRYPDARGGLQGALGMVHGLAERLLHQHGHAQGLRGVMRVAGQDEEFVAAKARGGVVGPGELHQALRGFHQDLVADGVAQRVVDQLETVEVDEEHREALSRRGDGNCVFHMLFEQGAVGQAGERIAIGGKFEFFFGLVRLGDVAHHAAVTLKQTEMVDHRRGVDPPPQQGLIRPEAECHDEIAHLFMFFHEKAQLRPLR